MVRLDTVKTHSINQMEERSTTSDRGNRKLLDRCTREACISALIAQR